MTHVNSIVHPYYNDNLAYFNLDIPSTPRYTQVRKVLATTTTLHMFACYTCNLKVTCTQQREFDKQALIDGLLLGELLGM